MICKICGRTITNEEANFCEYCGASFRPGMDHRIFEEKMHEQTKDGYVNAGQEPFSQRMDSMYQNTQEIQNRTYGSGQTYQSQAQKVANPSLSGMFSGSDKPMTFGNWIIIYLIPFIPMIGTLLFLVLLFTWGFGSKVAATKKNWARATLVFILIMIVMLFVLMSSGFMGEYASMLGMYGTGA